ncbi:MAG: ABC transporter permease subunit [Alphaproteobacteria bacterium]
MGKKLLLKSFGLTMVLPPIIAIVGLLHIFGNKGVINQLLVSFSLPTLKMAYNITGVLIIFTFFNIPFCCLGFIERLSHIPKSYWKSAQSLGFTYTQKVKYIELPLLKSSFMHMGAFVFLLCFTSFAPVLIMGGGKIETLTTALYHALKSLNIPMVVQISMVQFLWSFIAIAGLLFIRQKSSRLESGYIYLPPSLQKKSFIHYIIITILSFYILWPIISVIIKGLQSQFWLWLLKAEFFHALFVSLYLSIFAALLAIFIGIGIATYRRFKLDILASYLPLMIPSFILIAGLFIALSPYVNLFRYRAVMIIATSALMCLPLVMRMIAEPIHHIYQNQRHLAHSLNMSEASWYHLILWPQIKRPLSQSFAISMALSFGDFGVIAFLGSENLKTLPLLLYEQMGRYRFNDADALACILLLVYIAIFIIFMKNTEVHNV